MVYIVGVLFVLSCIVIYRRVCCNDKENIGQSDLQKTIKKVYKEIEKQPQTTKCDGYQLNDIISTYNNKRINQAISLSCNIIRNDFNTSAVRWSPNDSK